MASSVLIDPSSSIAFISIEPLYLFFKLPDPSPIFLRFDINKGDNFVGDPSDWKRNLDFYGGEDDIDDEEDEEEEEDRSLELLIKFVQNVFKKISRKAKKAVRSVLPIHISTKLVGFSVNGVVILAFLWILKVFLEVICTLGSVVFVSILLIRGILSY